LALKQTYDSKDKKTPLILKDYIDLGSYKDIIYKHETKNDISIAFEDISSNKISIIFSIQKFGKGAGKIFVKSLKYEKGEPSGKGFDVKLSVDGKEEEITFEKYSKIELIKKPKSNDYFIYLDGTGSKLGPFNLRKFYNISPKISAKMTKKQLQKRLLEYLTFSTSFDFTFTIEDIFSHIYHIGPLRHKPERVYTASGAFPQEVGESGEWTIDIIQFESQIRKEVKDWFKKFGISLDFRLEEIKKGSKRYEVILDDLYSKISVNLTDVGFGASQILPIIVQSFFSSRDSILLIEEPEIHLHPKAQCVMGDLFAEVVKKRHINLIIETHSDLLIGRICKHVISKDIKPEDIVIYYFDPTREGVKIKKIDINENGQYENFPEGFFEERFQEALKRAELLDQRED
jgi:hypothetical protein